METFDSNFVNKLQVTVGWDSGHSIVTDKLFEPHPFDFENEGTCEKNLSDLSDPSFLFTSSNVNQSFAYEWQEKLGLPIQTEADDGVL